MTEWVREINAWLGVASILGTCGLAVVMLYLRSIFATRPELLAEAQARREHQKAQGERLGALEQKVSLLDERYGAAPTQDDLRNLLLAIESVRGDVKGLGSKIDGVDNSVGRIGRNVDMLMQNELQGGARS